MVRPADRSKAVARMVELRAVQPRFPLYGSSTCRGADLLARAAGGPRRARAAGAADRARRRGRRPDRHRPGDVHHSRRHRARAGAGHRRLQPRAARDHRLRRSARRPACSASAAARAARCWCEVPEERVEPLVEALREDFKDDFINTRSFRSTEDQVGRDFDRAENYLSLVGLIIVILGGIAVSSVTRVFILQKIRSIAVLKCLGARSGQIIAVYILQVMALGLAGSLLGVAMARGVLAAIPLVLGASTSILAEAHYGVSWSAAVQGIGDRRAGVAAVLDRAAAAGAVHQAVAAAARRDACAAPRDWTGIAVIVVVSLALVGAHRLAGGVAQGRHRRLRRVSRGWRSSCTWPGRALIALIAPLAQLAVVPAAPRGAAPVAAGQPDARDPARRRPRRLLHRRRPVAAGEPARASSRCRWRRTRRTCSCSTSSRAQADGVRAFLGDPAHGAGEFQLIPVLRARVVGVAGRGDQPRRRRRGARAGRRRSAASSRSPIAIISSRTSA